MPGPERKEPPAPVIPWRLLSVWDPDSRAPVLVIDDSNGQLRRVGTNPQAPRDVAHLLALCPAATSLGAAVDQVGVQDVVSWRRDELALQPSAAEPHLLAPSRPAEAWAAGVTYRRSRAARIAESSDGGVYDRIYDAPRPELFLKATGPRIAGPGALLGLRADASWSVPEPELALVLFGDGRIAGFTLANDITCRDLEAANPLYLPQAKIFSGCVSIGPTVLPAELVRDPYGIELALTIERGNTVVFEDRVNTSQLHRTYEQLVRYLRQDNALPYGVVLLTGTGIVPPDEVTLLPDDVVTIEAEPIGSLRNRCVPAADIDAPYGWAAGS